MGNKSLCKWKKDQIHRELDRLAEIVAEPRYICHDCARAAHKKKYLCEPERIPRDAAAS